MPATDTIPHRLLARAVASPSLPAFHEKLDGVWKPTTWSEYAQAVQQFARALIASGFGPGQTVAILGFNRPEWAIADIATMAAGGAPAGIYTTCSGPEVAYILNHAESPVLVIEDQGQWEKIVGRLHELPHLRRVVCMRGLDVRHPRAIGWDAFLALGEPSEALDAVLSARLGGLWPDALATLIYTSGTTGPPKGVMLSHQNLSWTADAALTLVPIQPGHCSVSYLPLSHIAEQMFSLHIPISCGGEVYYAESLAKVPETLKEVQPHVLFAVPRIWEKFYAGVTGRVAQASFLKRLVFRWASGVASRVHALRNAGDEPHGWLATQYKLARRFVFRALHEALGLGRAYICVSGAAPVSKDILEYFAGLDIPIREIYGQSEGSGPTTFNAVQRTRFGTVGTAIPGCEVRIASDGEILVRGPNVFMGYFKDPVATAECFKNGYLYSGDLGSLDHDGFLTITGRKKDILITAGGKNIAPRNLEDALKKLPCVADAVVIGDRRRYLAALLTLDPAQLGVEAEARRTTPDLLAASPAFRRELHNAIEDMNTQFAQVEHIRRFAILSAPFSIETGELTPSMKIKRGFVNQKYASEIERMYAQ